MHVEHCGMGDGENVGNRRGKGTLYERDHRIVSATSRCPSIAIRNLDSATPPLPYRFIPWLEEYKGSIRLDDCDSFAVQVGYRWLIELQTSCPATAWLHAKDIGSIFVLLLLLGSKIGGEKIFLFSPHIFAHFWYYSQPFVSREFIFRDEGNIFFEFEDSGKWNLNNNKFIIIIIYMKNCKKISKLFILVILELLLYTNTFCTDDSN